jgi:TonB family protein
MSMLPALIGLALASAGAAQQTGAVPPRGDLPQVTVIAAPMPGQTALPPPVLGEGSQPVEVPRVESPPPTPESVSRDDDEFGPGRPTPKVITRLFLSGGRLPPLPAKVVREPRPKRPAQSYLKPADYPATALARKEQGVVRVELAIGPEGRVVGCAIQRSAGPALDWVTCAVMFVRARFTPARDKQGRRALGHIDQQLEWKLP